MKLNQLFETDYDLIINSLEDDSRIVKNNYLFFCIKGLTSDGHKYVNDAVKNGAIAIVASDKIDVDVPVIYVEDTNMAMIQALNKFYNNPLEKLKIIGVTGTDGKTTTTTMIYQIINKINSSCGLIGTNGVRAKNYRSNIENHLTTPLPKELLKFLNDFVEHKCEYVAMEVSSERLLTGRIDGLEYDVAIHTNISNDHMNIHKTMENYIECKAKIFRNVKEQGICIINQDDVYSDYFKQNIKGKIITYSLHKADVYASDINIKSTELTFKINGILGEYNIKSPISGKYNVYNLLAAIIAVHHLGFKMNDIISAVENLESIEGRANIVEGQNYKVLIDYAHNPNALKNLLEYANGIKENKVITVTGSAGGRDHSKRPLMGCVVTELSDYVIFTTDDPRNENPNEIINNMLTDVKTHNYEIEIDRQLAIKKAISMASAGDIVVIAGRGNDTNMPVKDGFVRINDIEEVNKIINE